MIALANSHYGVNNRLLASLEHAEGKEEEEPEDSDDPIGAMKAEVEERIERVETSLNTKLDQLIAAMEAKAAMGGSTQDDT